MKEHNLTISTDSGELSLSTGKIAKLADGSVLITKGGTAVFATATADSYDSGKDFFPLTVEYLEKMYAYGVISGSRVNKREGFPKEGAIIKARQVDHTVRPLFPKGFKRGVNLILDVMAEDGVNDPEQLTVLASSIAIMLSGIPFAGPAASVVVAVMPDGKINVNPLMTEHSDDMLGEFVISGGNGRILNIEGWGKELSEDTMDQIMDAAVEEIEKLNKAQMKFVEAVGSTPIEYEPSVLSEELIAAVTTEAESKLKEVLYTADKVKRDAAVSALTKEVVEAVVVEDSEFTDRQVGEAMEYVSKKIMRAAIMKDEKRFSGRALDEIRELTGDVDILPTVHGSAIFNRGLTQSLSITTVASLSKGNILNDRTGTDDIQQFMHHYNFPPYSVGEAGRVRYKPGRREIGHGAIGQNAIMNMFPSRDDFPYSVRAVSEITSSNGSTSMAATCATSMSLMAAGVPLKKAVAGIGVGLITSDADQKDYKLVLDIEGVEDFFGDMDFKVTGTDEGVTAIQFETKLEGVLPSILKESFRLSQKGRMQVLESMNSIIKESRENMAPTAPRVEVVIINPEMIGAVIGPGGKVIKDIIERGQQLGGPLDININDDGRLFIAAFNEEQMSFAKAEIASITTEPEIGDMYEGTVETVMPYGAFIALPGGNSGLVHVSEMSDEYVKDPSTIVKEGDTVKVKMIGMERGKISLSMKQAE